MPLLVQTHAAHAAVVRWWAGREVALSGHALAATYSVLTRLPGDIRMAPPDAARLLEDRFPPPLLLATPTARRLPIIAMTAGAMAGDREAAMAAGMDDYVTKPVKLDELSAALERWLVPAAQTTGAPPGEDDAAPSLDAGILAGLRQLEEDGGTGVIEEVVDTFLADAGRQVEAMRSAAARGDMTALARGAHSLRGSSASVAATRLAGFYAELD